MPDGLGVGVFVRSMTCSSSRGTGTFANSCAVLELYMSNSHNTYKVGQNLFQFIVTKNNVVPSGLKDDTVRPFDSDCPKAGYGCTAWVIYKENMDYLRCRDQLSWEGKTGCD